VQGYVSHKRRVAVLGNDLLKDLEMCNDSVITKSRVRQTVSVLESGGLLTGGGRDERTAYLRVNAYVCWIVLSSSCSVVECERAE